MPESVALEARTVISARCPAVKRRHGYGLTFLHGRCAR